MNFSSFECLPDCVVRQICSFLELSDFYSLREASKTLHSLYGNLTTPHLNSFVGLVIPRDFELFTLAASYSGNSDTWKNTCGS